MGGFQGCGGEAGGDEKEKSRGRRVRDCKIAQAGKSQGAKESSFGVRAVHVVITNGRFFAVAFSPSTSRILSWASSLLPLNALSAGPPGTIAEMFVPSTTRPTVGSRYWVRHLHAAMNVAVLLFVGTGKRGDCVVGCVVVSIGWVISSDFVRQPSHLPQKFFVEGEGTGWEMRRRSRRRRKHSSR